MYATGRFSPSMIWNSTACPNAILRGITCEYYWLGSVVVYQERVGLQSILGQLERQLLWFTPFPRLTLIQEDAKRVELSMQIREELPIVVQES